MNLDQYLSNELKLTIVSESSKMWSKVSVANNSSRIAIF